MAAGFVGHAAQGAGGGEQRQLRAGQRFNGQRIRILDGNAGKARQRKRRDAAVVGDRLGQDELVLARLRRLRAHARAEERRPREHLAIGRAKRVIGSVRARGGQAIERALPHRNKPGKARLCAARLQRPIECQPARVFRVPADVFIRRMVVAGEEGRALIVRHPRRVVQRGGFVRFQAVEPHLHAVRQENFEHRARRRPVGAQHVRVRAQAGERITRRVERFGGEKLPAPGRLHEHARRREAVALARGQRARAAQQRKRQT